MYMDKISGNIGSVREIREVVILRAYEELKFKEIAENTG